MLPVVTELHTPGLRVEDVGTATLPDHVHLEAGMDTHLQEGRMKGEGVRTALPDAAPNGRGGEHKPVPAMRLHPSLHPSPHTLWLWLTCTAGLGDGRHRNRLSLTCCVYLVP